ncbi:MAG: hypothetical protein IPM54_10865 [Polyangiaceae bacterium]|nr:hypothetical protein [Polyangiaceae bacterium]
MKQAFFDNTGRLRNGWWMLLFALLFLLSRAVYTPIVRWIKSLGVAESLLEPGVISSGCAGLAKTCDNDAANAIGEGSASGECAVLGVGYPFHTDRAGTCIPTSLCTSHTDSVPRFASSPVCWKRHVRTWTATQRCKYHNIAPNACRTIFCLRNFLNLRKHDKGRVAA